MIRRQSKASNSSTSTSSSTTTKLGDRQVSTGRGLNLDSTVLISSKPVVATRQAQDQRQPATGQNDKHLLATGTSTVMSRSFGTYVATEPRSSGKPHSKSSGSSCRKSSLPKTGPSPRPAKVYSSSKCNDAPTKSRDDKLQQRKHAQLEKDRSFLKIPPKVPVILCHDFEDDAPHNGSDDIEDTQSHGKHQQFYSQFVTDIGHNIEVTQNLNNAAFRASSAKSTLSRYNKYRSSDTGSPESRGKSQSHWGSFELSSDDERSDHAFDRSESSLSSPFQAKADTASTEKTDSSDRLYQPQVHPIIMGKEIGEDVTDADFESDEDVSTKNEGTDIKTLYERACRLAGVVSSKRIERELMGNRVYLDYAGLVTADVKAVCIALLNNTTVTRLDLSGNDLCGQAAQYISELINENNYITHLFCSTCQLRNRATDSIISSAVASRNIQVLDLSENKLQDDHLKSMTSLLKNNKTIKELRLRYCDIDGEGGHILAPMLAQTSIEILDLSWNQLRQKGGAEFCLALADNKSIIQLDLSWNGLGREGCAGLEVGLAKNTCLIQLNLESNRINTECLAHLLKGLERNKTLETINLTKNPISLEDAKLITTTLTAMKKTSLKVFDISDVTVDNDFIKAQEALQSERQISVYHGSLLQRPDKNTKQGPRTLSSFDPILVLFEYMKQQNLRLIDLFRNLDVNHDNAISKEELRKGFLSLKMNLPEGVLSAAFHKLDLNSNNQIDIDELKNAHRRVLRQTALLMAQSSTSDRDESYGDVLHDFRRMVKVATMFRRSTKAANDEGSSPRDSTKTYKDRFTSSGTLTPDQRANSARRKSSARPTSGMSSIANSLDPNSYGPQRKSPRRRSTSPSGRPMRLSVSSRGSPSGSDRSISPS